MIWELILKTFIPVSRIFDNEDDIFIFSRNVRKSNASENYLKKNQKYYEISIIYEHIEKLSFLQSESYTATLYGRYVLRYEWFLTIFSL